MFYSARFAMKTNGKLTTEAVGGVASGRLLIRKIPYRRQAILTTQAVGGVLIIRRRLEPSISLGFCRESGGVARTRFYAFGFGNPKSNFKLVMVLPESGSTITQLEVCFGVSSSTAAARSTSQRSGRHSSGPLLFSRVEGAPRSGEGARSSPTPLKIPSIGFGRARRSNCHPPLVITLLSQKRMCSTPPDSP